MSDPAAEDRATPLLSVEMRPEDGGPPPPAPIELVTTRRLLGSAFELLGRSGQDMRRASFYVGAIVLGTVGPVALAAWAASVVALDHTPEEFEARFGVAPGLAVSVAGIVAVMGLVVASVESRNVAVAMLGARLAGRPVSPRQALARSRRVFWSTVIAVIIVAIPLGIAQALVGAVVTPLLRASEELSVLTTTVVTATIGAPFAYVLSGVVLGAVDPVEAVRRSFAVFRARKLAASIVVVFETVAVLLVFLGVSAGLDVVIRALDALGLGVESGPVGLAVITGTVVIAVFAFGTLLYTVMAITVAPQVVMFVGLTHATFGLDPVRPGGPDDPDGHPVAGRRPFRTFTRPMLAGFVIGALGLAVAVARLTA